MLPVLSDVLALPALQAGDPVVRAGHDRLGQPVRWVHVSEVPWIADLLEGGELILMTGIALPRARAELRRFVEQLDAAGVCGLAVELGRRHRTLPDGLVAAALDADLPLVELRRESKFVAITQAVHTLILDARVRELTALDERQTHRTLLTRLAMSAEPPAGAAEQSAALRVPLAGRAITGIAVRLDGGAGSAADSALLRDVANRLAETVRALRAPALVAPIDDQHVAVLMSQDAPGRAERVIARLAEQVHATAGRGADATSRLVVGVGSTLTGVHRASTTLREAIRVADTAAGMTSEQGWFRASDLRLHGLVHELRGSEALAEFVRRELGDLLAHDAEHRTRLYDFLAVYCRVGGNKTEAAKELFVSRAALYERVARVEKILDVDLGDAQVVLSLHFAVLAHDTLQHPDLAVRAD